MFTIQPYLKQLAGVALGALLLTSCNNDLLDRPDPVNLPASEFWQTQEDALLGVNAAYSSLQRRGTYGRWLHFAYDLRSDEGLSNSPWTDLSNFTKSVLNNYDFEVNRETWAYHYEGIRRANQVLDNVPGIAMDEGVKRRYLAEARFLRSLHYYNLANLYGNAPLVLRELGATERPTPSTEAQVWAQVISDLQICIRDLPEVQTDLGRATEGAARGLLVKAYMQTRQWQLALNQTDTLANMNEVTYALAPVYRDNFTTTGENNSESLFEVQFSDANQFVAGDDVPGAERGSNRPKFIGAHGRPGADLGFGDAEATAWILSELVRERTIDGRFDPRANATLFWNKSHPDSVGRPSYDTTDPDTLVYGRGYRTLYGSRFNGIYVKKYTNTYTKTNEDFFSPINHKVIRYADILLLRAEAYNELNNQSAARDILNQIRARVNMPPIPTGLDQLQMQERIQRERVLELGLEGQRWPDLRRYGWLTDASRLPTLIAHDAEFGNGNFIPGKSQLLPIPQTDVDLAGVPQNPEW